MSTGRHQEKNGPMITIAVISQKGGAGKTTLALSLAVLAELKDNHTSIVVDLDPQATASGWSDNRSAEAPIVVSAQASRLQQTLATAEEHGATLAVIDTAPFSETVALSAARLADLILIPCRPTAFDLRAIESSVQIANLAQKTSSIVLNGVPPNSLARAEQAREAIAHYGIPIVPTVISHRVSFIDAATLSQTVNEYEPEGKAAQEIEALYRWLKKQVKHPKAVVHQ